MAKNNSEATTKVRDSFLWRFGDLDTKDKDRINQWLNNQKNVKLSLTEIMMYMIDRFGYEDISSHEIKKQLHQEEIFRDMDSVLDNFQQKIGTTVVQATSSAAIKPPDPPEPELVPEKATETPRETTESSNADIYNSIDSDGL